MEREIELDIVIVPEGKNVYSINAVQIPNVVTQGKNIEDAKRMLKEAFEEHPEARKEVIRNLRKESRSPVLSRIAV